MTALMQAHNDWESLVFSLAILIQISIPSHALCHAKSC